MLFTDTDSLCYVITTDDVYEDLFYIYVKRNLDQIVKLYDDDNEDSNMDLFDNSDYHGSSKFFFDGNKKVIGKFKDEAAGKIISEFVGEKPKMYSYKTEIETKPIKICGKTYGKITKTKESKTAKGVKKSVIRKEIKHQNYLDCIFNNQIMKHKMNTIRSQCHQVSSCQINKTSLSCYDDKRYILHDGISSLAYGHFSIDKKN